MKKEVFDPQDVEKNKVLAAIGYLGILFLIPLLFSKSQFAKYHGKQGLVLFIAEVLISFINIIPILGQLIWLVASLFFVIVSIVGIVKSLKGEQYEVPIIGKYSDKIEI